MVQLLGPSDAVLLKVTGISFPALTMVIFTRSMSIDRSPTIGVTYIRKNPSAFGSSLEAIACIPSISRLTLEYHIGVPYIRTESPLSDIAPLMRPPKKGHLENKKVKWK